MLSQNEIIIDQLRQYINKNARFEVIGRAFGYYPSLISNNANKLLFECSGSQIDPYDVFLDLHNYYNIKTSCSCPYNGSGICKHQVASIKHLIELIKYEKIQLPPKVEKVPFISSITYIPHNKGVIDVEELNTMEFSNRSHYYSPMVFSSINK